MAKPSGMIGCRVTKAEENKIKEFVERGDFMSVSDFVRTAVRKLLAEYKSK